MIHVRNFKLETSNFKPERPHYDLSEDGAEGAHRRLKFDAFRFKFLYETSAAASKGSRISWCPVIE
jgi:hypothetical protein